VEGVKSSPIEITSHVDESGLKSAVEVKVGVLSSQHEGAYFRVKLVSKDPATGLPVSDYSQPLKVISKRNQVKKIMERKQHALDGTTSTKTNPVSPPAPSSPHKRPASDMLTDSLLRLEQQQQAQLSMLQQLLKQKEESESREGDFEVAFRSFLKAFKSVPLEDRPKKLRRVMTSEESREEVNELLNCFSQSVSPEPTDAVKGNEGRSSLLSSIGLLDRTECGLYQSKGLEELEEDLYNSFLSDDGVLSM